VGCKVIICNLSIHEAAQQVAALLKAHYLKFEKPIVVGFDRDGDVNWHYDIEGMRTSVVVPLMTTEFDFALDINGDPSDPGYWTDENLDSIVDAVVLVLRDLDMNGDIGFV
jgi:hypothetical protein